MPLFPATTVTRDIAKRIPIRESEAVRFADLIRRPPDIGGKKRFGSELVPMLSGGKRNTAEHWT